MWSSEVEVKLMEGHGGEVRGLTGENAPPAALPPPSHLTVSIFRDVTLGAASLGGHEGRSARRSHNTITALLKRCTARLRLR